MLLTRLLRPRDLLGAGPVHGALLPLLAREAVGFVEQLLLALDHLLQLVQHLLALLHLAVLLADLQVFEKLLHLRQHLLRGLARARLDHVLHAVQHLLQILALDGHGVLVHGLHGLIGHLLHLLGERVEIVVEGLAKLVHQARQLLVAGIVGQRLLERLLQFAQLAAGERQAAVLEVERSLPHQLQNLVDRGLVLAEHQPRGHGAQGHEHRGIVLEALRHVAEAVHRGRDPFALIRLIREQAALLDDRTRDRMGEVAGRQHEPADLALPDLLQTVDRLQLDLDRQAGPAMRRQIEIGGVAQFGGAFGRLHQLDALGILHAAGAAQMKRDAGDAVIVGRLECEAHHLSLGDSRVRAEGDGRRRILDHVDLPDAEGILLIAYSELARAVQDDARLGAAAAGGGEGLGLAGQAERVTFGHAVDMVKLRQHLAAGRETDGRRGVDQTVLDRRFGRLQRFGGQTGIVRRGHPDDQPDRLVRRGVRPFQIEGLGETGRRHAAGLDQGDDQHQSQRDPERPAVAPGQIGLREPHLEAADHAGQPFAVPAPKRRVRGSSWPPDSSSSSERSGR